MLVVVGGEGLGLHWLGRLEELIRERWRSGYISPRRMVRAGCRLAQFRSRQWFSRFFASTTSNTVPSDRVASLEVQREQNRGRLVDRRRAAGRTEAKPDGSTGAASLERCTLGLIIEVAGSRARVCTTPETDRRGGTRVRGRPAQSRHTRGGDSLVGLTHETARAVVPCPNPERPEEQE